MACWQEHGGSQQFAAQLVEKLRNGDANTWLSFCHFLSFILLRPPAYDIRYYLHSRWVLTVNFIIVLGVGLVEKEHVLTTSHQLSTNMTHHCYKQEFSAQAGSQ